MEEKVFVGLSGGVDSTVTAALLKKKGYDVHGITVLLTPEDEPFSFCDAEIVAKELDIPFIIVDMKKEFADTVMANFIAEYKKGRTPNPCIVCNEKIKFGFLLQKVKELGGDFLVTGHYAKIEKQGDDFILKKSPSKKDQSYFLYRIPKEALSRIMFPINELEKEDIRKIAKQMNLSVAEKSESQEICFIKDNNYVRFLNENGVFGMPGNFVDLEGNVLGKHSGIINYTIGQRKGLERAFGEPMFVTKIDALKNEVVLAPNGFQETKKFFVENLRFFKEPDKEFFADVKIRCQAKPMPAKVTFVLEDKVEVEFEIPQRAVTPGQSAVFYDGDIVLGGGYIA
ncbi:MAG: tRNA 2-thiouridine(34) synthase MnmA [Ruminococcaceae bacterium]|nr:tRNA 2-thiouridine(34) synthase MnmA [Oscillospiraceae bacterium]